MSVSNEGNGTRGLRRFALAALVAGASVGSQAAPFTYTEGPDLPTLLPAASVFAFDVGANTVSGHVCFFFNLSCNDTFDDFAFSLPAGTQLTSATFSFQTGRTGDFIALSTAFALCPGNAPCSAGPSNTTTIDLLNPGVLTVFAANLPLGAGTFGVQQGSTAIQASQNSGFVTTYTWTFNVESVNKTPEPATLALLGLGLAGLAASRRRRAGAARV